MRKRPPVGPVLAAALRLRCPNCRKGPVFRGWPNRVHPRCPVCGLSFMRESGYYLGGMILTYIFAAFVLLAGYLLSLALPSLAAIPDYTKLLFWVALAIVLTLLFVRPA